MTTTATTLASAWALQAIAAFGVFFAFRRLRADYDRLFLRHWIRSWAALALALLVLATASLSGVRPDHPLAFALASLFGSLSAVQLYWLVAGYSAPGRSRGFGLRASVRSAFVAGILGGALALPLLAVASDSPACWLQLASSHGLAFSIAAFAGSRSTWTRQRRLPSIPMAIFSAALVFLAGVESLRGFAGFSAVYRGSPSWAMELAFTQLLGQIGITLAVVIMLLEDERATAIHAASQAEHFAYHDPLSGLPNRSLLLDRLDSSLASAIRTGKRGALLFLDLDRFKLINDSLGHSAGDALIRGIAERLRTTIGKDDTIARFGRDEFLVLLPRVDQDADVERTANRILAAMNEPFNLGTREIVLTTSIGVARFPDDARQPDELVHRADTARHWVKEKGRAGFRFFAPEMNQKALEVFEMESDLRRAILKDEFVIHYQPLIDVEQGRIFGLEALLRWRHPRFGLLMPDRFIPATESSGLIIPIGNWVLRQACIQARNWQKQLGLDLVVAVNLSPRQFDQADFVGKVCEAIEHAALDPSSLELEITESNAMKDVERTIRVLSELKKLGIGIAIDDFGTGYSSLEYLRRLPIDTLKLDQAFVREIAESDGVIARGVIAMAHNLKLRVLAEGVETLDQLEFLRSHACDRLQGFLFSRPLEPAMFEEYVENHGRRVSVA